MTRTRIVLIALAGIVVAGAGAVLWQYSRHAGHDHSKDGKAPVAAQAEKYTCGMHPFIISDKPGNCPICGMTLTKIEGGVPAAAAPPLPAAPAKGERKIAFYRNPMNPKVHSPVPSKDEMGMEYVPVYEDELTGEGVGTAGGAAPVEGYATIKVGAESLRMAGVRTAVATRETIGGSLRASGIVVPDEARIRRVQAKIDGYVEKLYVNATGQHVSKGQPLLSLYSPELLASQQEFLKARETAAKFSASSSEDVRKLGDELLQSSRRRLELFDVPESFIVQLERTGKAQRTVTLDSPVSGYVTGKNVFDGTRVGPGTELLTVTDLSRIWIEADLYEYEARAIRIGQGASVSLPSVPGAALRGRVAFVNPVLSPESRTLKVRFEFPNPGLKLKPQMYADVSIDAAPSTGVVIPDSALIESGLRHVAFVDGGNGGFEPREVQVGVRGDGRARILSGVKAGERVAVQANFLLDSESRLRAALVRMTGGGK